MHCTLQSIGSIRNIDGVSGENLGHDGCIGAKQHGPWRRRMLRLHAAGQHLIN